MPLKPNFSYEVTNTHITESGEGRISLSLKYTNSVEVDGSIVDTTETISVFNFGVGLTDPASANVESLLQSAIPQYFTE